MIRIDQRHADRGPSNRGRDFKTYVTLAALVANVCAFVWKGGEISGKFDALLVLVEKMNSKIENVVIDQNTMGRTLSAQQEQLRNHEVRITRIEDRAARAR